VSTEAQPQPVEAVPAATVILLRDLEGGGVEVYMLRRPARSSFAADAWVFPGGALDEGDSASGTIARAPGLDLAAAAARLGLDADDEGRRRGAGLHLCAVRELFEETGVLIGRLRGGGRLGVADADRLASARAALLEGAELADVLLRHRLEMAPELLQYVAHFITPADVPRRFDAYFFLTAAPPGQEAAAHPAEAVLGGWHAPAALLERHRDDPTVLMTPTRILLAELADQPGAAAAAADLGSRPVADILFARDDVVAGRIPTRLPLPDQLG
jgi:8-oxo-dGTP pyrophosphatase MutT (NUDIX family)